MSRFANLLATLRSLLMRRRGMRSKPAAGEIERMKRMIHMAGATAETEIACEEAYRLLDQYAEMVLRGDDVAEEMPEVKHHLEMCGDCFEELDVLVKALRATTD